MNTWMTAWIPARLRAGATPRSGVLLLLLAVLVVAGCWTWAAWSTPATNSVPVLVAGGASVVLLLAVGAGLLHQANRAARSAALVEELRADTAQLSAEFVPALIERLRTGASAATALDSVDQPEDAACRAVMERVATEVAASERRRVAAMAACATAAGRVQALTTAMLADLREMQERHGSGLPTSDVLGDLMHLDHSTAQAGRIADSIAVLTGARSGRRWSRAIPMESVLRGAMGRIGAYQRVRTHSVSTVAVAGYAAEGIMHALAELLDNAATFSPPTAEVHVYVEEVQAGIAILVEDGGLVMGEDALERAREAVASGPDLSAISGTRLGLAVVGSLAHKYGLSVSFRTSARGGTAAVLLLPQGLIKPDPALPTVPADQPPARQPQREAAAPTAPVEEPEKPLAATATAAAPRSESSEPENPAYGASGLPMRRRGQTLAAAERTRTAPTTLRSAPTTPVAGFGAFRSAVRKPQSHSISEDES